jgi:hypothetical protein
VAFAPADAGQRNAPERECDPRTPQERHLPPRKEHSLRGQLAAAYHRRERDPERILDLRRQLAAQQIRDHITRILGTAPQLTIEQRRELAALVLEGPVDASV